MCYDLSKGNNERNERFVPLLFCDGEKCIDSIGDMLIDIKKIPICK